MIVDSPDAVALLRQGIEAPLSIPAPVAELSADELLR